MPWMAGLYLLPVAKLEELRRGRARSIESRSEVSNWKEFLESNGRQPYKYYGTGYIFGLVQEYLQKEKGIFFELSSGYEELAALMMKFQPGWKCFVFNQQFKESLLAQLHPSRLQQDELGTWLWKRTKSFGKSGGKTMLDAFRIIHKYLELVDADTVFVLCYADINSPESEDEDEELWYHITEADS